jgi:hypothetical protein
VCCAYAIRHERGSACRSAEQPYPGPSRSGQVRGLVSPPNSTAAPGSLPPRTTPPQPPGSPRGRRCLRIRRSSGSRQAFAVKSANLVPFGFQAVQVCATAHASARVPPLRDVLACMYHLPALPSSLRIEHGLRNARAPTSPRSIGFCVIWDCISSSSSSSSIPSRRRRRA